MKSVLKTLGANLKQAILSKYFIIVVLLTFGLYLTSSYEIFIKLSMRPNTDVLYFFGFLHNVGIYESMLVLCSVLPFGLSFYFDWSNKNYYFSVARCGKKSYSISKICATAVSGGAAIALGMLLFLVFISFFVPWVDVKGSEYGSYVSAFQNSIAAGTVQYPCLTTYLLEGNYVLFYALSLYLIFLYGAFWAVVGLCASAYIPNPFITVFSPYILLFVSNKFIAYMPLNIDPVSISRANFNIGTGVFGNMTYATLFFIILILCFGILFNFATQRRIQDEFY